MTLAASRSPWFVVTPATIVNPLAHPIRLMIYRSRVNGIRPNVSPSYHSQVDFPSEYLIIGHDRRVNEFLFRPPRCCFFATLQIEETRFLVSGSHFVSTTNFNRWQVTGCEAARNLSMNGRPQTKLEANRRNPMKSAGHRTAGRQGKRVNGSKHARSSTCPVKTWLAVRPEVSRRRRGRADH